MECSSAPRPFVKWIRKARTEAKLSGFSLIHFKQEIPGDFATGLFWAGNRCWNCVASISVQKKSCSKTCLKGLGRITGLSFHSKYLLIFSWKMSVKFYWKLVEDDDDDGFLALTRWSWLQLSMQMVFLWIQVWLPETEMSLSCTSFPWSAQCHCWFHSKLPPPAKIQTI